MYRLKGNGPEVLLVHPGGPFWEKKDLGVWSMPKGEYQEPEDALAAAQREFLEETGFACAGPFLKLGTHEQPSGKLVTAWAFEGDCDPSTLVSNAFAIEWPSKSGTIRSFPEVDRAAWFQISEARRKIHRGQLKFLDELEAQLLGKNST
jgi:predicted NUDIX family NTP pyrophosphohydrolase